MDNISLNYEEISDEIENLKNALTEYESYGDHPFDDYLEELGDMNSDFIAKLITMVENLNKDNKKLLKNYKAIASDASDIAENLLAMDEDYKGQIEDGSQGDDD